MNLVSLGLEAVLRGHASPRLSVGVGRGSPCQTGIEGVCIYIQSPLYTVQCSGLLSF
jgi:hypothetical protein